MDSQTNLAAFISTETPDKLSCLPVHRSSTPYLDLSMSEADLATLHTKDSQEIKPWTIFNTKIMAVVKENPKPVSKGKVSNAQQRVTPITMGRRLAKDRVAIAIHHSSTSKLDREENTSKDNIHLTDMSLDMVRPRAQTDITAVLEAERRKSPETGESKEKLLKVGRVESEKRMTQSSRPLLSANSSLVRKINLSRNKNIDKTFDDGKLLEPSYLENSAHNMSSDHVYHQPNKLPAIGGYNVLEALKAKKMAIEHDKKYIPQMFLRDELEEKPKPKTKPRLKSELACWRDHVKPAKNTTQMKTEASYGYLGLPKPPKNLLNLLVCPEKPKQKPLNTYIEDFYKSGSEAKRTSGFSYLNSSYLNSSIRTRLEGAPFKRKNSPGPWGPSGRKERMF